MDNSKRNVHSSGALGELIKRGQIKRVTEDVQYPNETASDMDLKQKHSTSHYFKTETGIKFNENELVFLNPKECESWEYANRSNDEMGEMDELIESIKNNTQLQPVLIRSHPAPYGDIKYQIIFGKRRHAACLKLNIPLLAIKKDTLSLQEAIACQDAENKFRNEVSNFSNAILYKKLLDNKAFKTEKELAEYLRMSASTLNDLMAYTKIPSKIIALLPDVHTLPVYLAVKITRILSKDTNNASYNRMLDIAPEIGKSITTPSKLDLMLKSQPKNSTIVPCRTLTTILDKTGNKLFTYKIDHKGTPSIIFEKALMNELDFDKLCVQLQTYITSGIKSGRPDLIS